MTNNNNYKPGMKVPTSGQYKVYGPRGGDTGFEVTSVKGEPFPADSIIIATSATIGEHALITVPSLANQRFTYLMIKDQYTKAVSISGLILFSST